MKYLLKIKRALKYDVFYQIIAINIILYVLAMYILPDVIVEQLVGYSFFNDKFQFWQPITSMFLHANFFHLFLNMFVLLSLARENAMKFLSNKEFLILYFVSGLAGYFLQALLSDPSIPGVGASGAIFGLLGAIMIMSPDTKFYIIFFPFKAFKAKYLISSVLVIELLLGIFYTGSGIGHFCHLGGGIGGIIIAGFWLTETIPSYFKRKFNI